tara:strand:- start:1364 stop:3010 length:1647 start_codon:yes stop_codon:yes gene_type:complete
MSLKSSQVMPVENYSVVQQSENGTQFGPNSKIRFRIGSHLGFIDFHTSYLMFNLQLQNPAAKMEFNGGMGADIVIRTWRLLIGGHIVEEIDHPNVLLKTLKYDYGQDLGQSELCEVLDKSGKGTGYQGLNPPGISTIGATQWPIVKCVLDLGFSGVFGSTQSFPVGMTGDVEIEITLEDQRKCFQVVKSGLEPFYMTQANARHVGGKELVDIPIGTPTFCDFRTDTFNQSSPLCGKCSTSSLYLNDQPFCIGNAVQVSGKGGNADPTLQYNANSTADITGIANSGGVTRLTVGLAAVADGAVTESNVALRLDRSNTAGLAYDNNGTFTYEISVPSLVLQVVVPPQQYIEEMARKVATEGYSIDIPTYTCYKTNTIAGVGNTSIEIPCYSSRARSLLCIGVESNQPLGGNAYARQPFRMEGSYNDLDNYQFQIGEEREPVRPVNCSPLSTYQHNVSQEQITELEKALRSSGCNVRSLKKYRNNFVIGRALSAYGGTIPLTMKGARVYIDYLQTDRRLRAATTITGKQWFNYCHHIRRLNITPQGIQVMY